MHPSMHASMHECMPLTLTLSQCIVLPIGCIQVLCHCCCCVIRSEINCLCVTSSRGYINPVNRARTNPGTLILFFWSFFPHFAILPFLSFFCHLFIFFATSAPKLLTGQSEKLHKMLSVTPGLVALLAVTVIVPGTINNTWMRIKLIAYLCFSHAVQPENLSPYELVPVSRASDCNPV